MNRKAIALIAVILLALFAGCSSAASDDAQTTDTPEPSEEQETRDKITRVVYPDDGVVCYVMDEEGAMASGAGWESGISCLPLNQTNVEAGL